MPGTKSSVLQVAEEGLVGMECLMPVDFVVGNDFPGQCEDHCQAPWRVNPWSWMCGAAGKKQWVCTEVVGII